mmetsp:Transcript_74607/g.189339  ORF Transcript_74607/g.189339 Transcript_74607/m.189339 type:complete len:89 (-) Transcript_74607:455-721(-)
MTMLDRDKCDLIQQLWEADPETLAQITEIAVVGSNKMTMLGAKQTLRERLRLEPLLRVGVPHKKSRRGVGESPALKPPLTLLLMLGAS